MPHGPAPAQTSVLAHFVCNCLSVCSYCETCRTCNKNMKAHTTRQLHSTFTRTQDSRDAPCPRPRAAAADNTNTDTSKYPLTPVVRRPSNRWRPTQHFQTLPPKEQILTWLDFHADQLDASNRPQHQYLANLLFDSNITYKDITDFRQYTYVKWNEATQQYDQFQYNAISLPYLNTKASRTSPPPVSRATSTHREVAHINAGHTGPVGNITNILRQGRFLPSTLHFPNYPGFFAQGVRITHNQQATPQEHPLPHRHTPGMGRRHEIHFWRRRAGYDPSTRPPRSRLSSERQMLGHPPRPCHRQRPGMVHQLHPTGPMTPPHTTSLQPPIPTFCFTQPHFWLRQQPKTMLAFAKATPSFDVTWHPSSDIT